MDKATLEEKRASIEQQFNSIQDTIKQHQQTITSNQEEALKLAGEFRLVNDLLSNIEPVEKPTKEKKDDGSTK